MWYHLSLILDAVELGVAFAGVTTATALSQVIGGPLAAALLLLDGILVCMVGTSSSFVKAFQQSFVLSYSR